VTPGSPWETVGRYRRSPDWPSAGSASYFFIIIVIRHETTAAARWALPLIVCTLFNDAIAVALWTGFGFHVCLPVDGFASPTRPAVIRGAVQPVIKLGLEHWPNPIAAVVIGYTISSAVLIFAAFVHDPKLVRRFDRRGALWFAAVGLCNGSGVLSLYAALGRGPVTLVAPLVASYPLVTLLLSFAFLKHEHIGPQLVAAVAVIVGGVVLLIIA